MPPRRPLLKRTVLCTAAVVLLLAWYEFAAPFVAFFAESYVPQATPVLQIFYAPLLYVAQNPDAPGHTTFVEYVAWSMEIWVRIIEP